MGFTLFCLGMLTLLIAGQGLCLPLAGITAFLALLIVLGLTRP
ncbi:hypothetical protein D187_008970 [Cystobacter fuscus DSM 2262]|uniref:Uncharacterized protein n=1 Tax=Cystobacter fuscus (strain ATCC 25194 / DSM 2262 / NBRC 100088 / M29) TaxID=1242864 RepID=S9PK03_CYSF2|nr:hypothetical protein D187_008970 [Cystobacter fuscus DSM 2262]